MEKCGYRGVIACSAQGYFCSIDVNLTMPPPFLEPSKTAEKAFVTVIQEAWIGGVSTRRLTGKGRTSPLPAGALAMRRRLVVPVPRRPAAAPNVQNRQG